MSIDYRFEKMVINYLEFNVVCLEQTAEFPFRVDEALQAINAMKYDYAA